MVKPAMSYLDVLADAAASSPVPVWAYQVTGEYAMIEAAAAHGWIDRERAIDESLTGIRPRRRRRRAHLLGDRGRAALERAHERASIDHERMPRPAPAP